MHKHTILMTVAAVFILGGLSAGAYYLLENLNTDSTSNDISFVTADSSSGATQGANTDQNNSQSQNYQLQQPSNLQVQNDPIGQQSNQQNNQLPTPEQFSVYEEYANAESTQYIDIVVGAGQEVVPGDAAALVYSGWLTDGTLFDQTRQNEEGLLEPFVFTLGQGSVIQGWEQGIAGMKVGGKRRLIIPPQLGYGQSGNAGIPPNAQLIFDVELVQAQKQ